MHTLEQGVEIQEYTGIYWETKLVEILGKLFTFIPGTGKYWIFNLFHKISIFSLVDNSMIFRHLGLPNFKLFSNLGGAINR